MKTKNYYIKPKELHEIMCEYREAAILAEAEGREKPLVPDKVGRAIQDIAHRLSTRGNFRYYSYREEMIMDGVEKCLRYIDNYDHKKYDNPFSYFTKIVWYAFVYRIKKEKKQLAIKFKAINHMNIMNMASGQQDGDDTDYGIVISSSESTQEYMDNFLAEFEKEK